jgi:hypothetical protein
MDYSQGKVNKIITLVWHPPRQNQKRWTIKSVTRRRSPWNFQRVYFVPRLVQKKKKNMVLCVSYGLWKILFSLTFRKVYQPLIWEDKGLTIIELSPPPTTSEVLDHVVSTNIPLVKASHLTKLRFKRQRFILHLHVNTCWTESYSKATW